MDRETLIKRIVSAFAALGEAVDPAAYDNHSDDQLRAEHDTIFDAFLETYNSEEPREAGATQDDLDQIITETQSGRRAGFVRVPNWLVERTDLSDGDFRLYVYLLSHEHLGTVCIGQETMATAMGCTSRTIRDRLSRLENPGDLLTPIYINQNPKNAQANRYKLHEYVPRLPRKTRKKTSW